MYVRLQAGTPFKPDYKAVREAIASLLEAEDYDDGTWLVDVECVLAMQSIRV